MRYYLIFRSIHFNGTQDRAIIPALGVKIFENKTDADDFIKSNRGFLYSYELVKGAHVDGSEIK